jgi:hypothetical protein
MYLVIWRQNGGNCTGARVLVRLLIEVRFIYLNKQCLGVVYQIVQIDQRRGSDCLDFHKMNPDEIFGFNWWVEQTCPPELKFVK